VEYFQGHFTVMDEQLKNDLLNAITSKFDELSAKLSLKFDSYEMKSNERFAALDNRLLALEKSVGEKLNSATKTAKEANARSKAALTKADAIIDMGLRNCRLKLDGIPSGVNPDRVIKDLTAMLGFDQPQVMSSYSLKSIGSRPATIMLNFSSEAVKSFFHERFFRSALKEDQIRKLYAKKDGEVKLYLSNDLIKEQYQIQRAASNYKKTGDVVSHFERQGFVYIRFEKGAPQTRFDSVDDFEAAVKKHKTTAKGSK
jgi:hypothetical protein